MYTREVECYEEGERVKIFCDVKKFDGKLATVVNGDNEDMIWVKIDNDTKNRVFMFDELEPLEE